MPIDRQLFTEHLAFTRRSLLKMGVAASALGTANFASCAEDEPAAVAKALAELEPYFTAADDFRDVSRGKPLPHSLPQEKKQEVGLTRDSWNL
jgi:hypothetical protein